MELVYSIIFIVFATLWFASLKFREKSKSSRLKSLIVKKGKIVKRVFENENKSMD